MCCLCLCVGLLLFIIEKYSATQNDDASSPLDRHRWDRVLRSSAQFLSCSVFLPSRRIRNSQLSKIIVPNHWCRWKICLLISKLCLIVADACRKNVTNCLRPNLSPSLYERALVYIDNTKFNAISLEGLFLSGYGTSIQYIVFRSNYWARNELEIRLPRISLTRTLSKRYA